MKTIKIYTMLFALTVIANIALATGTGNLRVDIRPIEEERAVVAISNSTESKYEISIMNRFGEEVFYKETEGTVNDYRKIYDFSKLTSGDYTMTVTMDGAVSEREFSIKNKSIDVGKMTTNIDPYFSSNESTLRIAYLNYADQPMDISIYDDGAIVYEKVLENTFGVNEALGLSKLEAGNYRVVLAIGKKAYGYNFEVE